MPGEEFSWLSVSDLCWWPGATWSCLKKFCWHELSDFIYGVEFARFFLGWPRDWTWEIIGAVWVIIAHHGADTEPGKNIPTLSPNISQPCKYWMVTQPGQFITKQLESRWERLCPCRVASQNTDNISPRNPTDKIFSRRNWTGKLGRRYWVWSGLLRYPRCVVDLGLVWWHSGEILGYIIIHFSPARSVWLQPSVFKF